MQTAAMRCAPQSRSCAVVVEDFGDLGLVLSRCLHRLGFRVIVCPDGGSAMEALASTPEVALLVADADLPRTGGAAMLATARAAAPGVPVLILSSSEEAGPHPVPAPVATLQKPFGFFDLADAVSSLCPGRERPSVMAGRPLAPEPPLASTDGPAPTLPFMDAI